MSWMVLAAMAVLQLLAGVVRVRAWYHVIRDSWPQARSRIRYRDVVLAQLGGMGWNAVLPARAGDAVKVAILNERMPERRFAFIAATTVPPAIVEAVFTVLLVAGLAATGVVTGDMLAESLVPGAMGMICAAAVVLAVLAVVFRRRLARLLRSVRSGLAVLVRPRVLATRIVPWLLAGRLLRLGAYALVLPALGAPLELAPAVAIMALQGVTPSAGAAASAARIALLSAVLVGTGVTDVPAEQVAMALVSAYAATTAINLIVSAVVVAWVLRTVHPRRIGAYIRSASSVGREARAEEA